MEQLKVFFSELELEQQIFDLFFEILGKSASEIKKMMV